MRSAGHLGWAFPAGLGAKCGCPDRPVVTFTGDAGLWYHIGRDRDRGALGHQLGHRRQQQSSGNQSKRGFDRAYGGTQTEQARELWTFSEVNFAKSPRTWARSASAWRSRPSSAARSQRALKANRPVIIDVVTDIEALAPLAVT